MYPFAGVHCGSPRCVPRTAGRYAPGPHEACLNPRVDLMQLSRKRTKPARRAVTAAGMSGGIEPSEAAAEFKPQARAHGQPDTRRKRDANARPGDGHLSTMMIGSSGT